MTPSPRAVYARHVNNPNPEIAAICREEMKMDDKQKQAAKRMAEVLREYAVLGRGKCTISAQHAKNAVDAISDWEDAQ